MRLAALNSGSDFHLLDHIAPLAALLEMPLIVFEERNFELALRYYPQVQTLHWTDLAKALPRLAERYDALFECKYWAPHLKEIFRSLYGKEMRLVFCPHGQSDKGYLTPLLAPYATQDALLIYGDLMIAMLEELSIDLPRYARIGNYRLQYYLQHRAFYDRLAEKETCLDRKNLTLLYAPTWRDADASTSFFEHGKKVIEQLPSDWNLLIKLHPLLEQRDPSLYYSLEAIAENKERVSLLKDFPPVYPLLSLADAMLGDASSVGYDALCFQKPLFFFPTSLKGRLRTCGKEIDPSKEIYSQLHLSPSFASRQQALCELAFGQPVACLKKEIEGLFKP